MTVENLMKMPLLSTVLIVASIENFVFSLSLSKTFYKTEDYETLFEEFITKHEKAYASKHEKQIRYEIFTDKLEQINNLNLESEHAVYGINRFTDYTKEELEMHTGLKLSSVDNDVCNSVEYDVDMFAEADEDSFDWRDHNVVTEVKNQGQCGSCWTFSTIGNIEGLYAIKNKELVNLSEQQIVDCDQASQGCNGGDDAKAMREIIQMGGVMTEKDYPYVADDDDCYFNKSKVKVQLTDCNIYDLKDEENLKNVLKTVGPLSMSLDFNFIIHYNEGIVHKACSGSDINHAVLLVGWGSENDVPYWIFKNSWGTAFGENGYFRLKRGINSACIMVMGPTSAVL